jgi:hypothetical protein
MGITAAIHTLGMLLIFVPFMALDARRTKVAIKTLNPKPLQPYAFFLCKAPSCLANAAMFSCCVKWQNPLSLPILIFPTYPSMYLPLKTYITQLPTYI